MTITKFEETQPDSLKPGWTRLSLSQAENFSIGYFHGLEDHPSASHHHDYEQLTILLEGCLRVTRGDGTESLLSKGDCASVLWRGRYEHCPGHRQCALHA